MRRIFIEYDHRQQPRPVDLVAGWRPILRDEAGRVAAERDKREKRRREYKALEQSTLRIALVIASLGLSVALLAAFFGFGRLVGWLQ